MLCFFLLIIAIAVVSAVIRTKLPYFVGRAAENFVTDRLLRLGDSYIILNDLLLPSGGNLKTTQIDHVVVSNYGIFCIETKAYQGWIFGNANQRYWTQVIYRRREKFYNPLWQNYAHTKALESLIMSIYPKAKIVSLIAFPDADKIKVSGTNSVGHARDVVSMINRYTIPILSDSERDEICKILLSANMSDKESRQSHVQNVRNLKNEHCRR